MWKWNVNGERRLHLAVPLLAAAYCENAFKALHKLTLFDYWSTKVHTHETGK